MLNYRCNILLFYAFTCRSSNKSRPREAKISDSNLSVHKILLQYHVGAHFRCFCLFCVRSNNFFIAICPCRFADFSSNFWSSFRHTSSYWFPLLHDLQEMLLLVFVFLFLYNPRLALMLLAVALTGPMINSYKSTRFYAEFLFRQL